MAIEKFTIKAAGGREEFRLYAEPNNIKFFVKSALTPDVTGGVTNKQVTVKATTVRQYPGDGSTFNRPGSSREILIDPSRKSGNGLPGRSFVLLAEARGQDAGSCVHAPGHPLHHPGRCCWSLMAWQSVGSINVGPGDSRVVVGPIEVPPDGGVELMVRQTTASPGFKFAYGIAAFESREGRPLGSVKFWAGDKWEAFRLGAGLSSQYRIGSLVIEPRSYNLAWAKNGYRWGLEFRVDQFTDLPQDRELSEFENEADRLLRLVKVGTQGRLQF